MSSLLLFYTCPPSPLLRSASSMTNTSIEDRRSAARLSRTAFRLVLGSQSPRRRQLLDGDGYRFAVLPADDGVEENVSQRDVSPHEFPRLLALAKARNVAERLCSQESQNRLNAVSFLEEDDANKPYLVLACDSVAVCRGEILGKPDDRDDAKRMLTTLSGSRHEVVTGVALWRVDREDYAFGPAEEKLTVFVETSVLQMEELSSAKLEDYLDGGLWQGKAGAFGYQDGVDWLELISGSESNVVGLPLEALAETLTRLF